MTAVAGLVPSTRKPGHTTIGFVDAPELADAIGEMPDLRTHTERLEPLSHVDLTALDEHELLELETPAGTSAAGHLEPGIRR